jgi:hypothetical protein
LALGTKLNNFQIYDFSQNSTAYNISYINQSNYVIRISFSISTIGTPSFGTSLVSKNMTFTDLAA